MKLISLNGVQKERRVMPTLEVILLLQFFEQNMEKKEKMEMVFNIFLLLQKKILLQIILLLLIEKQIQNIKITRPKNIFLLDGQMIQLK
jgi:hypothetical protein